MDKNPNLLIVGNAPCADTPETARLVLGSPLVLRMNDFAEESNKPVYTPNRCDIWGVNHIRKCNRPIGCKDVWWTVETEVENYDRTLKDGEGLYTKAVPWSVILHLKFDVCGGRNPTTGLQMIYFALKQGYYPAVCGFDWFATRQVHWWHMSDQEKSWHQPDAFKVWHRPELEKKAIKKLAEDGRICLYAGNE